MKTIQSIVRNNKPYHPAVGYYYDIVFADDSKLEVSDDELIEQFGSKYSPVSILIGEKFNTNL